MNWEQIEGNWEKMKGKVKETWGKLTDDDITKIKGRQQILSGKIQERYGSAKDVVEKEMEKFLADCKQGKNGDSGPCCKI